MPQLNLAPWFLYLLLVWLIFTYIAQNKISHYLDLNDPKQKTLKTPNFMWMWPWQ